MNINPIEVGASPIGPTPGIESMVSPIGAPPNIAAQSSNVVGNLATSINGAGAELLGAGIGIFLIVYATRKVLQGLGVIKQT
ncbi:MAG: hypothetical protein O2904_00100 [bacterium]|nr:hypothetical protein [bacterium]